MHKPVDIFFFYISLTRGCLLSVSRENFAENTVSLLRAKLWSRVHCAASSKQMEVLAVKVLVWTLFNVHKQCNSVTLHFVAVPPFWKPWHQDLPPLKTKGLLENWRLETLLMRWLKLSAFILPSSLALGSIPRKQPGIPVGDTRFWGWNFQRRFARTSWWLKMKQSYIKVTEPNSVKFGSDLPLTMKCKIMLLNLHRSLIVFLLSFSIQTV